MKDLDIVIKDWLKIHNLLLKNRNYSQEEVFDYRKNLELLMGKLLHYVYFILLNRTNKNNAQELTSKALLKIYKNLPKYKGDKVQNFKAWVYKITINTFHDYLRKSRRSKLLWFADLFGKNKYNRDNLNDQEYYTFDNQDNLQLTNTNRLEAEVQVKKLFNKLKPQDRDLLLMRFYYGMSYKEIADILEIMEGTARKRMQRLLEKIRKILH